MNFKALITNMTVRNSINFIFRVSVTSQRLECIDYVDGEVLEEKEKCTKTRECLYAAASKVFTRLYDSRINCFWE